MGAYLNAFHLCENFDYMKNAQVKLYICIPILHTPLNPVFHRNTEFNAIPDDNKKEY